jgi:hypothetical protein
VTVVGFTGHQNLTPATRVAVAAAIAAELSRIGADQLAGLSSLAAGADQAFAFCVLAAGGRLTFIQPDARYRETLTGPDRLSYDHLVALAADIEKLPFDQPSEAAFYAAGQRVVDKCDVLLAVWDGRPAGGLGGTADIVRDAREKRKPVSVIWPPGAARG